MEKVQLFQDKKVRTHWDAEKEERYFSVVDAVGVLKDSPAPRNYWKVLKHRLIETSNEAVTNCNRLKMLAQDGKVRITDVADTKQLRIVQSIPSPRAAFKQWLATGGSQAVGRDCRCKCERPQCAGL